MSTSKKSRKAITARIIGIVLLALALVFVCGACGGSGGSGTSDETVSQAALAVAEQDYGYKLDLKSYKIVDSFTAKSKNALTGEDFKGKMYLVIVEADAKDSAGNVVETVKYGVSVVDPKEAGSTVAYSPFSQAANCTGMEDADIEAMLKEVTAAYH